MSTETNADAVALDGNAAAGLLGEIFAVEMTGAIVTCDACGSSAEMGAARLFGAGMGAVFRCVACDAVVVRLAKTPHGLYLDARGARRVFLRIDTE
jgi:hypothetical protein